LTTFGFPEESVLTFLVNLIGVLLVVTLLLALVAIRLRIRNERRGVRLDRLEAEWTPLLTGVAYQGLDPEDLRNRVRRSDEEDFVGFVYRFASRVRGAEFERLRSLALPFLPSLVERMDRGSAEWRARRLQLVSALGIPEYTEAVVAALDDESPLVGMIAARRLFRPGNEAHFDAVLARLDRFREWSPRFLAGMLAGGGPAVGPVLLELLADRTRSEADRAVAAEALTLLHELDAAAVAAQELEAAETRSLRMSLLRLLDVVGSRRQGDTVRRLLESDDMVVRQGAVDTLGSLGDPTDAPRLVALLDDPSPWVRMRAAGALDALGARGHLLAAADSGSPGAVAAAEVLEG
jgi:HEAT repeat protein